MRRAGKASLAVVGGYTAYVIAVQGETYRQINARSSLEDPTKRYAPIKVLGRYTNPFPEYRHQTLFEFSYRRISELFKVHPPGAVPLDREVLRAALPVVKPDFGAVKNGPSLFGAHLLSWLPYWRDHRIALTWLGQSCAYIQLPGNVGILTDPMFSNSVVSERVGPQRLVPPPVSVGEIPNPDLVLVSHDHQDHLDLSAANHINAKSVWVVPMGVKKHLPAKTKVVEMSWWDKIPLPNCDPKLGYEIACTPAMHWSGRALVDSNTTLWCSFMILRHGKPLFFHAGDSGYAENLFSGISKVYGKGCKLAMIPCGAYHPRWHLRSQHMDPTEALQTMKDLGASRMVGVHWGTFVMSEEPFDEPPKRLKLEASQSDFRPDSVIAPTLGKTLVYSI